MRAGEFRPPAALEPADELPRPHAKGQAPETVHQAPQQFRLPLQPLRQGLGLVAEPGLQQGRPVEPVVIDGIGDRPGQLPEGWIQGLQTGGANREPLAKGLRRWTLQQLRQQLQQRPNQVLGPPGIGTGALLAEPAVHQLPQQAAREGEAQVRGDAGRIGQGQLLPEPAARRPGVHHHLGLLEQSRRMQLQVRGQDASQQLSAVAAINREQGSDGAQAWRLQVMGKARY